MQPLLNGDSKHIRPGCGLLAGAAPSGSGPETPRGRPLGDCLEWVLWTLDAAVLASLAASTSRRVRTGTSPASAISGSLGVLIGQPVTTRAAARISRSRSSTYASDAAGSHAAAAYSSAPRTYPLATVRSCDSLSHQERAVSLRS